MQYIARYILEAHWRAFLDACRCQDNVSMEALCAVLGTPPVPHGSWERAATYVSAAAVGRAGGAVRESAEELAVRLRAVPGVRAVQIRQNGFLVIEIAIPGEIVPEILAEPPSTVPPRQAPAAEPWPDFPRTWNNPGFVVRYAYVRAGAVLRWALELGFVLDPWPGADERENEKEHLRGSREGPRHGDGVLCPPADPENGGRVPRVGEHVRGFHAELLTDPRDRAVLRLLAEMPSRRVSRDPGWPAYLERLAEAYHDAFEQAPATPKGDEPPSTTHLARLHMAQAVQKVLAQGLTALRQTPPTTI